MRKCRGKRSISLTFLARTRHAPLFFGSRPDDTACVAATCDPSDGTCKAAPFADGTLCDDGAPCTLGDACKDGACVSGKTSICACQTDADCPDDGNKCNGPLACDTSQFPFQCATKPATVAQIKLV